MKWLRKWFGKERVSNENEIGELRFLYSEPVYCYDCEGVQVESYYVDEKGRVHTRFECKCGVIWV